MKAPARKWRASALTRRIHHTRGKGRGSCVTSTLVADAFKRGVGLLRGADGKLYVPRSHPL